LAPSLARSLFTLGYERLGALVLLSLLRALPWLLLGLTLTYLPVGSVPPGGWLLLCGALVLLIVLVEPWLGGAAQRFAAALARGGSPGLAALLRGVGPSYGTLLGWTLLQALLALLLLVLLLAPEPGERGRLGGFGLASGLWLWVLSRLWGFVYVPLVAVREQRPRQAARLALLLLLERPGPLLGAFLGRQLLGILLALSGLGLVAGLGGLLPLQAALALRDALRPHGLELAPAGSPEANQPLDLPTIGQLWRPWR